MNHLHSDRPVNAGQQYVQAYAAQYAEKNLPLALSLYQRLLESYPSGLEADYSRMQVQNMVSAVIPAQTVLNVQIDLLQNQFQHLATSAAGHAQVSLHPSATSA